MFIIILLLKVLRKIIILIKYSYLIKFIPVQYISKYVQLLNTTAYTVSFYYNTLQYKTE